MWNLVVCSQSSFYVTRARKDDKNRQNTLFFAKRRWNLYPTNNCYALSHFNQPSKERKNCVWTSKYKSLLEMCIVQHVEMKSVLKISTNKTTSFYDCKKCKACCHVLNNTFNDHKPTILLFGSDGTHCFARKTCDYEKGKPSPFLNKILGQSQPSTSESETKKSEALPFMAKSCRYPIGWHSWPKFHLHSHFIHFQSTLQH